MVGVACMVMAVAAAITRLAFVLARLLLFTLLAAAPSSSSSSSIEMKGKTAMRSCQWHVLLVGGVASMVVRHVTVAAALVHLTFMLACLLLFTMLAAT
jgi:hypothetical protein